MRIYILGGTRLETISVKDKTEKNVSVLFKYNNKIDININLEKRNNKWVLFKNNMFQIEKDKLLHESIALEDYELYFLNLQNSKGRIAIIPTPNFENESYDLSYKELSEFTVGKNSNCNICYNNSITNDIHAKFTLNNDNWIVESVNQSLIYVNNKISYKSVLRTGDIIFINGLKIIWNNEFFRINKPLNSKFKGFKIFNNEADNKNYDSEEDNENVELYNEEDYFYPKLLINNVVEEEEIKISNPPQSNLSHDELPFILSLGSSITMLGTSFMAIYMIVYNLSTGNRSIALIIPQIVICVTMLIGSLLMPRLVRRYNKKIQLKREKIRVEKYTKYLEEKEKQIDDCLINHQVILNDNNPSIDKCITFINNNKVSNVKFWSRSIKDFDFANIRLGNGETKSGILVGSGDGDFKLESDELEEKLNKVVEKSKMLYNVPIVLDLKERNKTGIMFKLEHKWDYIGSLLTQLITLQSPFDLKIVIFTTKENRKKFEYMKYLPHVWSDDKSIRFFASSLDEIQKISDYLSEEYRKRLSGSINENSLDIKAAEENYQQDELYKKYSPYYIIIDDNYSASKNSLIVRLLNETAVNLGFSYLGIGEQLKDFPNDCSTFVDINEKNGNILQKNTNRNNVISFNNEYMIDLDYRKIANQIANIPIKYKSQQAVLPQVLQFLEMLDVSRIEQLNIINRWKIDNPVSSLSTIVGVDSNGDKFRLDLHEKAHGPHGLVAGMTGSGKSEFLLTYILSMMINYHPYEVQFVLIDYKGGGLAGAFENKELGYKVPHLVGTITNLDTAEMNRTLVSIESECRRRQKIFNEVRDKLGEGTIDIYKYQRLYREGIIKEPMAHLFIISDEFAELKAQQPEFMQQLISVARIGRSLGIHLILATQKPSGVVNDQIWSNSKFKVCLKVQDRSDSMEMLKKPDAASIREIGRFYLQVGYDDFFDIGQSGWSGAKYVPSDYIIRKIDDSINFVNNYGEVYKTIKNVGKTSIKKDLGDQLTNIVKYICDISNSENITTKNLWLDKIPNFILAEEIKKKYNYKQKSYVISPVIGEYDDPKNQKQGLLTLDISNGGNTLIYGQTGSGKEHLLSTIITSIAVEHNPNEVNIYILDFGTESLKIFNSIPHVGDIATIETPSKVEDTFNMLYDILEERKKIFSDYAGNYQDYIKNSNNKLPLIVVIINNYEIFVENHRKLSDYVVNLYRDASKYGIMFIVTSITTAGVRGRLAQNFHNLICLQLPDKSSYREILGAPKGLVPSECFARGLIKMDDDVFEFQTASYVAKEKFNEAIRTIGKEMRNAYSVSAKKIPTIPDTIVVDEFEKGNMTLDKIPVGYEIIHKSPITYDASQTPFTIITTEGMSIERMSFIYAYIHLLTKIKDYSVKVVDFIDVFEKNNDKLEVFKNTDKDIVKLYNEIVNNSKNKNNCIYIMLGLGQIVNNLSKDTYELFNKALSTINNDSTSKFVIVDTYNYIKKLASMMWYQIAVDNSYGIWLGENVGTQLAININNLSLEDRKIAFNDMAFIVNNGKYKIIKHMVDCEAQEDEE